MQFLIAPALFAALSLIGFSFLPRLKSRLAIPLSLSAGALITGWLTWVAGYLIGTTAAMIVAALLLATSFRRFTAWRHAVSRFARELGAILRRPATILLVLLLLALVPQLAAPLVDSDGLRYHAALPKLFLLEGQVSYYPYDVTGAFPQAAEMLYLLAMPLGGGEAAKVLHFLFFLATLATLILIVHRNRATRTPAVLSAFLLAASPVALAPAASAFIDHIALFHIAAALLLGRHAVAALPLAAACATKLTAAPAVLALMLSVRAGEGTDEGPPAGRRGRRHLFALGRRGSREASVQPWATSAAGHAGPPEAPGRSSRPHALKTFALIALVIAAAFAPFAIRNVIHTGDPVHPIGRGLLRMPIPGVSSESLQYATQYHSRLEGIVAIPWLPQRGVVQDDEVVGIHHLLGLFALVLAIRQRRLRAPLGIVIAYLGVALLYRAPARYLLPMFLALAIFEGVALARTKRFAPLVALLVAIPALLVSLPLVLKLGTDPARVIPGYRATEVVNRLPNRGKVMALDFPAPYYFDRPWIVEGILNEPPLKGWVSEARTPDDLLRRFKTERVHLLVITPGYGGGSPHTVVALASDAREAQLLDAFRRRLRPVARIDSVDVFEVP